MPVSQTPSGAGPAISSRPPEGIWRVARSPAVLNFAEIGAEDATLPHAGNRFDVPGGGVLYCATDLAGCCAETLARFRPTPAMHRAMAEEDASFMMVGGVPADWRHRRLKARITTEGALPFLNIEAPQTREWLQRELADALASFDVSDLDVSVVRGGNRLITRTIARWAYDQTDATGNPLYSGIRYLSRLGTYECWAVFDGTAITEVNRSTIELSDPALQEVQRSFSLRVF